MPKIQWDIRAAVLEDQYEEAVKYANGYQDLYAQEVSGTILHFHISEDMSPDQTFWPPNNKIYFKVNHPRLDEV